MSRYYRRLCRAVTKNDVDEVDFLLNVEKVDPNPAAHYRTSPLWIACKNNNLEIVELLVTNQFNPADPNTIGISLLHKAVKAERATLVQMLLKAGANPTVPGKIINLPIYCAVDIGNVQIVQLLFQFGSDFKACLNILLVKAAHGSNCDVLEFLLQHAHSKNLSRCAWSLMDNAIWRRDICVLNILLGWGFFTNDSTSSDTYGVFKHPIGKGMTTIMKMLVEVNPQCLQESWKYPNHEQFAEESWRYLNCERFPAELIEARKHPVRLDILCRTKIIQQLGFKPISKVETLPLPRILKNFVQFKNSNLLMSNK